jgi:hypothetical protein
LSSIGIEPAPFPGRLAWLIEYVEVCQGDAELVVEDGARFVPPAAVMTFELFSLIKR